jgi:opacity protein-like surface antigen
MAMPQLLRARGIMIRILSALLVVSVLSSSATASQAFNWTGFYIGAHGGNGRADPIDMNLVAPSLDGYLAGFQIGYLWAKKENRSVVGIEADFSASNVAGLRGTILDYRLNFLTTIRGRYGYADGQNLYFVTAGLAHGEVYVGFTGGYLVEHHVGYSLGFGFERAITTHWTARAEYIFTRFGTTYYDGAAPLDWKIHATRLAVNYRF